MISVFVSNREKVSVWKDMLFLRKGLQNSLQMRSSLGETHKGKTFPVSDLRDGLHPEQQPQETHHHNAWKEETIHWRSVRTVEQRFATPGVITHPAKTIGHVSQIGWYNAESVQ